MKLLLPTIDRDGADGTPVTIETDDVAMSIPKVFDGDGFFNVPIPITLVYLRDGTMHRINKPIGELNAMTKAT